MKTQSIHGGYPEEKAEGDFLMDLVSDLTDTCDEVEILGDALMDKQRGTSEVDMEDVTSRLLEVSRNLRIFTQALERKVA